MTAITEQQHRATAVMLDDAWEKLATTCDPTARRAP